MKLCKYVLILLLFMSISVFATPVLYTSPTCGWCNMIKHEMALAHIKYIEKPSSESPVNVVPVLKEDNGKIDVGYDQIHQWIQSHLNN